MTEEAKLLDEVLKVVISWKLPTILVLIGLDWAFGVLAGLRKKEFNFPKMGDVYLTNVLPFLGGYILLAGVSALVGYAPQYFDLGAESVGTQLSGLISWLGANGGFGVIVAAIVPSIMRNMAEVYTGSALWRDDPFGDNGGETEVVRPLVRPRS